MKLRPDSEGFVTVEGDPVYLGMTADLTVDWSRFNEDELPTYQIPADMARKAYVSALKRVANEDPSEDFKVVFQLFASISEDGMFVVCYIKYKYQEPRQRYATREEYEKAEQERQAEARKQIANRLTAKDRRILGLDRNGNHITIGSRQ